MTDERRDFFKNPSDFSVVSFLIAVHSLVALPLAYVLNAWVDECSALFNTEGDFFHVLDNVFHTEKQAPLYFLLLNLWRSADSSVFFARLFSVLCACLSIKFFYDLASYYFDRKRTIALAAFFALHPYLFWASLEIRLYAFSILLSILILKFASERFFIGSAQDSWRNSAALIATAIVGLYTNYYLGFLLAGIFVGLLATRRWQAAKDYFLQMLVVGAAIIPLAWIIKAQLGINTAGHKQINSFPDGLRILWSHYLNFLLPTDFFTTAEQTWVSFLRLWAARLGILATAFLFIAKRFRRTSERTLFFGSVTAVVTAFMLLAFTILGGEYISIRHASVLFAPFVIFAASVLADAYSFKIWIVLALICAFLFPYSIYKQYPALAKRGDWGNIGAFIEANEKPNQPIILSQAYDAITIPYHYKGINKFYPDEKFFVWDLEDSLFTENAFAKQTDFIISKIPKDAEEIWFLSWSACHESGTEAACRPLENYLQENYTVVKEKDFYLEKVRLLRKK